MFRLREQRSGQVRCNYEHKKKVEKEEMEAGSGSRDKSHLQACEHHAFIKVSEQPARERKEAKLLPLGHEKMTDREKEGVSFKDNAPGPLGLVRSESRGRLYLESGTGRAHGAVWPSCPCPHTAGNGGAAANPAPGEGEQQRHLLLCITGVKQHARPRPSYHPCCCQL